ncbi:nuclear transport factor 2 family protein [Glutamicibacter uratoxydans]|uniref:nuclear transport factor 2 family protein n=1 Tax=Glutamicibacter uratoxydans TaxID=43667 RepID=UPI003D6FCE84
MTDSTVQSLEIREPEGGCGNAPRAQIVRDLIVAIQSKDLEHLHQWLSPDVQWEVVGFQKLDGLNEVSDWVTGARDNISLSFNSILTHGREACVDGQVTNIRQVSVAFSYVFRFASTAKTAKVDAVRAYLVSKPV